jgi:hypothetical protein
VPWKQPAGEHRYHQLSQRRQRITLEYAASNAAGAVSSASKAMNVDNITPSVSLSAPSDTASTSGTEDVTATGSAGPSGVAAIY